MAIFGHLFLDRHRFLVILLLFLRLQGRVTQEIAGNCVSPKPPTAEDCQIHIQEALKEFLDEHGIELKDELKPSEESSLDSESREIEEEVSSESLEEDEETEGPTEEDDDKEHQKIDKEVEEDEDDYEEDEEPTTEEETEKEEPEEDSEEGDHQEDVDTEEASKDEEAEATIPESDEEEEDDEEEEEDDEDEEDTDEDMADKDMGKAEEQHIDHDDEDDEENEGLQEEAEKQEEPADEDVEHKAGEEEEEEEEEEEDEEEDEAQEVEEEAKEEEEEQEEAKDKEEEQEEEEEEEGEEQETDSKPEEEEDEEGEPEEEEEEPEEELQEEETVAEKQTIEEEQDKEEDKHHDHDDSEEGKQEIEKEPRTEGEIDDKSEEFKSAAEDTIQSSKGNETSATEPFDRMPEEPSEEAYIIGAGMAQELSAQDTQADQPVAAEEESTEEEEEEEEEELDAKDEDEDDKSEELTTEEEEEESMKPKIPLRNREHIDELLGLNEIGTQYDKEDQEFIRKILDELKKIYEHAVKPLEMIYKFRDLSTRLLGDAEIYAKPMVLFVGPWSSGKSSVINYLLNTERTPAALKTGPEPTDVDFTLIEYGDTTITITGSELATDWAFSSVQKFGQGFLEHFKGIQFSHRLLKKLTLVDTPGIMENRKPQDRGYPFNDALQWFIDRADVIYVVLDPSKLEMGSELESLLDQLKGREAQIRFILNKADTIRRSDILKVIGQLFWNLSPLMGSSEAPVIYAVSLMTKPFHPGSPAKFLLDQEMTFLNDLRETIDKRVENRILFARRHAVRVRNHAKMVDCYLSTYYKHKSIFSNRKKIADQITENPDRYSIYQGLSTLTNVSRYDLPDPDIYREFFNLHPLYDFKPLQSTCSYFRGCPLDKLDIAISYDLPDLLKKYKKHFNPISNAEKEEEKSR